MSIRVLRYPSTCLIWAGLGLVAAAQSNPNLTSFKADKVRLSCLYQCQYQLDSLSPTQTTERMRLQIGQNISRFESLNSRLRDSLISEVKLQPGQRGPVHFNASGLPTTRYFTTFRQLVYKIPAQQTTLVYDRIGATKYWYQEPQQGMAWQITPETQEIAGYQCQRAVTQYAGRSWVAWFAKDIPVSDGPYTFSGLPGLIVRVEDARHQYRFELLGLSRPKQAATVPLPDFPSAKIEKAAFVTGKAQYERTLTDRLISEGAFVNQKPEELEDLKRKAKARLAAQNNPLELR